MGSNPHIVNLLIQTESSLDAYSDDRIYMAKLTIDPILTDCLLAFTSTCITDLHIQQTFHYNCIDPCLFARPR